MLVKEEKMASGPEPPLLQVQKSLSLHRNTSLNSSGQEGWILGGRFQLQQRIGVGGFANIYVAGECRKVFTVLHHHHGGVVVIGACYSTWECTKQCNIRSCASSGWVSRSRHGSAAIPVHLWPVCPVSSWNAEDLCTGQRVALKAQSQEVTGNALRVS